jgi:hypothetical protein
MNETSNLTHAKTHIRIFHKKHLSLFSISTNLPICETIAFRLNSKDTKGLLCDICALHTFQASLSSFTSPPC